MQIYKLKNKENYQNFVKDYREIMKEGKEAEVFLGTEPKYRFRQRDSYDVNTYFSYKLDKNLFSVGFGYSQARHVEKRGFSGRNP